MHIDLQSYPPSGFAPINAMKFYETAMTALEYMDGSLAHTLPDPQSSRIHFEADDGTTTTITFDSLAEHRLTLGALRALNNDVEEFFLFLLRFTALMAIVPKIPSTMKGKTLSIEYEFFVAASQATLDRHGDFELGQFLKLLQAYRETQKAKDLPAE